MVTKIFKEKPGIISKEPVWICLHNEYIYIHDNLLGLLWITITEWNQDRHLVM